MVSSGPGQVELIAGESHLTVWVPSQAGERNMIGASPSANWVVRAPGVAGQHAELYTDGKRIFVTAYAAEVSYLGKAVGQEWMTIRQSGELRVGTARFLVTLAALADVPSSPPPHSGSSGVLRPRLGESSQPRGKPLVAGDVQYSAPSGSYSAPSGSYSAPSGSYSAPSGSYSASNQAPNKAPSQPPSQAPSHAPSHATRSASHPSSHPSVQALRTPSREELMTMAAEPRQVAQSRSAPPPSGSRSLAPVSTARGEPSGQASIPATAAPKAAAPKANVGQPGTFAKPPAERSAAGLIIIAILALAIVGVFGLAQQRATLASTPPLPPASHAPEPTTPAAAVELDALQATQDEATAFFLAGDFTRAEQAFRYLVEHHEGTHAAQATNQVIFRTLRARRAARPEVATSVRGNP